MPDCSASGTDFLPIDYSDGTATAADTASESAPGSDAGSAADIPASGHACTAEMNCLGNRGDCFSRTGVTHLMLPVFHPFALSFSHDCSVNHMLKGGEV